MNARPSRRDLIGASAACRRRTCQTAAMDSSPPTRRPWIVRRPSVFRMLPSTCALDVEVTGGQRIGRIHGARTSATPPASSAPRSPATPSASIIPTADPPAVASRPERLGQSAIDWNEALDPRRPSAFSTSSDAAAPKPSGLLLRRHDGLVMRDGIERRPTPNATRGSSARSASARPGPATPRRRADFRRQPERDGEVRRHRHLGHERRRDPGHLMTHATRARKERGATIVAMTSTTRNDAPGRCRAAARPGADGALACAVMHVSYRDGLADRDYMGR